MEVKYKNLDSNKEISFEIADNKKIVVIYGKNGSGKTTLSRSSIFDDVYVFNLDFVHNNVYIVGETGPKLSSQNKDGFSNLFIGAKVVGYQKNIEAVSEIKIEIDKIFDNTITNLKVSLGKDFSGLVDLSISKISDDNFDIPYDTNPLKLPKLYNYLRFTTSITDDEDYERLYAQYKEQSMISLFVSELNKSELLTDIAIKNDLGKYEELVKKIGVLGSLKAEKTELEAFEKDREIDLSKIRKKWVEDLLKKQGTRSKCILCGTENVLEKINEWKKFTENKYIELKSILLNEIEQEINVANTILNRRKHYNQIAPNTIDAVDKTCSRISEYLENIRKDDFSVLDQIEGLSSDKISTDTTKLMTELLNYRLNKEIDLISSSKIQSNRIKKYVLKLKGNMETELLTNAEDISKEINGIFDIMNLKKRFNISIERRGGIKYKFTVDGKQVDTLSEGQRHKLALAIFIKYIQDEGLENKTVIFDDPVVSLDEETYHALRNIIIKLRITEDTCRVIILTHNIYYTYVQLSNIFDNSELKELTSLYRMTSNSVVNLDIDILKTDDIVLFKKCLNEIKTEDEILILGGITNKLFRYFIDIKLRFQGISSKGLPADEIDLLDISESNKTALKKANTSLKRKSMLSRKPTTNTIIECFEQLKIATDILGHSGYINDSNIIKLKELSTNKMFDFNLTSDNIYFDFVSSANEILYTDKYTSIKRYLEHPRQQITKQITSISNDLSDE